MKATKTFLCESSIFISTPINKSSFLFCHITLDPWHLFKDEVQTSGHKVEFSAHRELVHTCTNTCRLLGSLVTAHTFCISASCPHVRSREEKCWAPMQAAQQTLLPQACSRVQSHMHNSFCSEVLWESEPTSQISRATWKRREGITLKVI